MSLEEGIQEKNKKDKLQADCREILEGIYPDIVYINCRTGNCIYIKDREGIAGKKHTEHKWQKLREDAMRTVCPEDLERCRTFTSMENLQRIGGKEQSGDTCIFGRIYHGEYCLQQSVIVPEGPGKEGVLLYTRDADEAVQADEHMKRQLFRELQRTQEAELARTEFLRYADKELQATMDVMMDRYLDKEGQAAAAVRMGRYIKTQMADITRLSSLKERRLQIRREVFAVDTLLEDCREYACSRRGDDISFQVEVHPELQKSYYGDVLRLMQVLFGLLANGYDYNCQGGSVRLEVGLDEAGESVDKVFFQVSDTGRGIHPEFLPRLYDRFAREQPGDLEETRVGLGLFVGKIVLDSMGGTIEADSVQDQGSSFRITVPLVHVEAMERKEDWEGISWSPRPRTAGEKHVLLVDDNAMNLEMAAEQLKEDGHSVVGCLDGREALRTLTYSMPGTFDLVLTDMDMPGMDGTMLAEKIRKLSHPDSERICIMGLGANRDALEKSDKSSWFDHILGKPFDIKAFRSVVQENKAEV